MNPVQVDPVLPVGVKKRMNYTQFSVDNHVNMIPEEDFQRLVQDTFETLVGILKRSFGPYGGEFTIMNQNESTQTKDGYNIYQSLNITHNYKKMVYITLKAICERVNRNVGDGTTTCMLLGEKIFRNIAKLITTPEVKRQLLKVLDTIEKDLENFSIVEKTKEKGDVIQPLTPDSLLKLIRLAANYDEELSSTLLSALDPISDANGHVRAVQRVIPDIVMDFENSGKPKYQISKLPGDYRCRINIDSEIAKVQFHSPIAIKTLLYNKEFGSQDWTQLMDHEFILQQHIGESRQVLNEIDMQLSGGENLDIFTPAEVEKFRQKKPELLEKQKEHQTRIKEAEEQLKAYQSVPVLIIARSVDKTWFETQYVQKYMRQCERSKKPLRFLFCQVVSDHLRNTFADLSAVLDIEQRTVQSGAIDFDKIDMPTLSVHNGNALCIHNAKVPERYISKLQEELDGGTSLSYVRKKTYMERIDALKLRVNETVITITGSSPMEVKLLSDKIDDCIAITDSALNNGIVPNMLSYAWKRMDGIFTENDEPTVLQLEVVKAIQKSIEGIFDDIWNSKHGESNIDKRERAKEKMYSGLVMSYDIMSEQFVDVKELPTSAQYDLEVVVASIAIVKYLLTSRALIFDSFLMQQHGDEGTYTSSIDFDE